MTTNEKKGMTKESVMTALKGFEDIKYLRIETVTKILFSVQTYDYLGLEIGYWNTFLDISSNKLPYLHLMINYDQIKKIVTQ